MSDAEEIEIMLDAEAKRSVELEDAAREVRESIGRAKILRQMGASAREIRAVLVCNRHTAAYSTPSKRGAS